MTATPPTGLPTADPSHVDLRRGPRVAADRPTPLTTHPVVARALAWIADAPQAPLVLAVCGPGGTGKSTSLTALRAAYRAAGADVMSVRGRVGLGPAGLERAGDRPLLVDDAHLLPGHTLEWLLERADTDGARLVVAHRTWPRPAPLADLVRELDARAAVVQLGALDRSAVATLAGHRLGRTAPASLVDDVLRATAGLPRLVDLLLTGEVLAGWASTAAGARPATPGGWLPPDLLTDLDADLGPADAARRAVVLALALGSTADPAVLAPALGLSPDRVAEELRAARAAGLTLDDGTVVPVVRRAVLAACPPDAVRTTVRALARAALDRGDAPLEIATRLGAARGRSPELATALRHAAAARGTDPAHAGELLAAAVDAGDAEPGTTAQRAEYAALAGDLTGAARLAQDVLSGPESPATARAASVAVAVLAHRGQLAAAATLSGALVPDGSPDDPGTAVAVVGCGGRPAGRRAGAPGDPRVAATVPGARTYAEMLLVRGLHDSLQGDGRRCLADLAQASALLGDEASTVLLPDTPAALAALAALASGEPAHAQRLLCRALTTGEGGPVAQPRHHLLLAWTAMIGGRCDEARAHLQASTAAGTGVVDGGGGGSSSSSSGGGGERDELLRRALDVGLARRSHDLGALARAWPDAWDALLRHSIDLFMLPALGEIAVAAARLDRTHQVAPQLDAARDLLARAGEPVLWAAPLHWYGIRSAIVAERPEAVAPHAAALVRAAAVSRHAAMLAEAAKVWVQVLAGRIDADAVDRSARRLHAAGLGWDGARLAAHAAARITDQRSGARLMQVARDLHRAGAVEPAADPGEPASRPPSGAPEVVSRAASASDAAVRAAAGTVLAAATDPAAETAAVARSGGGPPRRARPTTSAADGAAVDHTAQGAAPELAIHLSDRELEVARLVVAGHTYREISEQLYISAKTVEHHVARMRQRLGLDSRAALLAHLRARLGPSPAG